jgi:hypothetical protein
MIILIANHFLMDLKWIQNGLLELLIERCPALVGGRLVVAKPKREKIPLFNAYHITFHLNKNFLQIGLKKFLST